MDRFDPPFRNTYKILFDKHFNNQLSTKSNKIEALQEVNGCEFDLPLIDLSRLNQGGMENEYCKREIAKASVEWGFFQVVNHGVSQEVLDNMRSEQVEAFKKPFQDKVNGQCELDFPVDSYRWGTASATCLRQLAWSEAFHVPLSKISTVDGVTGLRRIAIILLKNGKWIAVNPKQETLIVIIGDLFQAWSNGTYKSVEHRVVANKHFERFSTAYFLCPSYDTIIESCEETSVYRRFSFKEFKQQVQDDVNSFGQKSDKNYETDNFDNNDDGPSENNVQDADEGEIRDTSEFQEEVVDSIHSNIGNTNENNQHFSWVDGAESIGKEHADTPNKNHSMEHQYQPHQEATEPQKVDS
nr:gibberellin 2-beta-dioxygenase 8-like [Tanacetum cinerariifolium]GEY72446.1 gibberellin 2-beta-dioxygenase 8-like [Tanacetum cinerariifolium]